LVAEELRLVLGRVSFRDGSYLVRDANATPLERSALAEGVARLRELEERRSMGSAAPLFSSARGSEGIDALGSGRAVERADRRALIPRNRVTAA
jgi:hypothetical protein